jgi:hypothetical protein
MDTRFPHPISADGAALAEQAVRYWQLADNPTEPALVRYWTKADIA